ncbi:MAG: hypothetical protein OSA97_05750 [Nevskia sp.]|nr:hypothetical protein [Nevskia sp.]
MNLRFSTRGEHPEAIVHLTVLETLRFGEIVRRRGEALCRPKTSLPNLEPLPQQILGSRRCCPACIDRLSQLRLKFHVDLPTSAGICAGDLIRDLAQQREAAKPRRRRRSILSFPDD